MEKLTRAEVFREIRIKFEEAEQEGEVIPMVVYDIIRELEDDYRQIG